MVSPFDARKNQDRSYDTAPRVHPDAVSGRDEALRKELHEISDWLERVFKGGINFQECEYMALRAHQFLADLDDELVENVGRFRDASVHQIARVISDDPLHQFSGKGSGHPDFMRLADRIVVELRRQQHSLSL